MAKLKLGTNRHIIFKESNDTVSEKRIPDKMGLNQDKEAVARWETLSCSYCPHFPLRRALRVPWHSLLVKFNIELRCPIILTHYVVHTNVQGNKNLILILFCLLFVAFSFILLETTKISIEHQAVLLGLA